MEGIVGRGRADGGVNLGRKGGMGCGIGGFGGIGGFLGRFGVLGAKNGRRPIDFRLKFFTEFSQKLTNMSIGKVKIW